MTRKSILLVPILVLALILPVFAQIDTEKILIDGSIDAGYWIFVLDFDKDGDDDILASSLNSGLRWYQNDGAGNFTSIEISSSFTGAWSIHANDMDNDGDLDAVACSDEFNQVAWFERKADDNFKKHIIDDNSLEPHSVYSADLDNDGDIDVMASVWVADQVVIFENNGSGNFSKQVIDGNFNSAHAIHAADMDNDGDIDILAGGGSKTTMYKNKGSLNFTRIIVAPNGAFGVNAIDVNGDGLLDILRNERPDNDQDIDWLENNGDGSFAEHTIEDKYGESWSQTAVDLDFDGDIDILAAGFVPNKLSYWLNNGNQGFSEIVLDNNLTRPRSVALGDFDTDGDKDIAVITRNTDNLFWYKVAGSPGPENTLVLTSPNGGEALNADSSFSITWSSEGEIDSVRVEYSTDNGLNWSEIVAGTQNNGTFSWLVPSVQTTLGLVRISELANAAVFDISDTTFSVVLPSLTLTAPNGGENWMGGSTQAITWNGTGSIDSVRLEFSADNGALWTEIIAATPNSGTFDWLVTDVQTNTGLVRISDSATGVFSDMTDTTFTIIGSNLTLLTPNGAEIWNGGSSQAIAWNTTGSVQQVNLDYSMDQGQTWNVISSNEANTGGYLWEVPEVQSGQTLVRVSDADDGVPSDQSDSTFTIISSTLTLTSPNGGETWRADSSYSIAWTTSGILAHVRLEYSLDNGQAWVAIVDSTPNTGSFAWTVPQVESQAALIRIADAVDGTPEEQSDSTFSIFNAELTLTSPVGGETWFGFSEQVITWQSTGVVDFINIEFSLNDGASWATIHPNAPNSGSYLWAVPNTPGTEARVRISDAADGTPMDAGISNFAISGTGFAILAPNGGETFYAGAQQTIVWTTYGQIDTVKLVLTGLPGDSLLIADNLPNSGSYLWQVPNIEADSVRIRVYDASDNTPWDVSDSFFSIKRSSLVLTAPNGGETWLGNTIETIRWETAGVVDSVNIEYSPNGGATWETVVANQANSGSFSWHLPNVLSLSVKLRISSAGDASIFDESDAPFAIISSSLTVTSPNGGEQWGRGTVEIITWHSSGIISAVDLEYSADAGHTWTSIAVSTANDGTYEWLTADIESDSVFVRISNSDAGMPWDKSDAPFQLTSNVAGITGKTDVVPEEFKLMQNYPNPFNMDTRIDFAVAQPGNVKLNIFNIRGEHVVTLHNGPLSVGEYSVAWNGQNKHGRDLTTGVYLYIIRIGTWQNSKRLLLLK